MEKIQEEGSATVSTFKLAFWNDEGNVYLMGLLDGIDRLVVEYYKGTKIPIEERVTILLVEEKSLNAISKLIELDAVNHGSGFVFSTYRFPNAGKCYFKLVEPYEGIDSFRINISPDTLKN